MYYTIEITLYHTIKITLYCTIKITLYCTVKITMYCTMKINLNHTIGITLYSTTKITLYYTIKITQYYTIYRLICTPKQLHQYHEQKAISDIQELITLKLMPLPRKWWKSNLTLRNPGDQEHWWSSGACTQDLWIEILTERQTQSPKMVEGYCTHLPGSDFDLVVTTTSKIYFIGWMKCMGIQICFYQTISSGPLDFTAKIALDLN